MAVRIQRSSGNVFEEVGFPRAEAAHLLIRTDLMLQIARVLKARKLTQSARGQIAQGLSATRQRSGARAR